MLSLRDDEFIDLFHATTPEAAAAIERDGFVAQDLEDLLHTLSATHDVDSSAVRNLLRASDRYQYVASNRATVACFSYEMPAALRWAEISPEAARDILWAIWYLTHGGPGDKSWATSDPEGTAWVRTQLGEKAAIVRWRVQVNELLRQVANPDQLRAQVQLVLDGLPVPEAKVPYPLRPDPSSLTITVIQRPGGGTSL